MAAPTSDGRHSRERWRFGSCHPTGTRHHGVRRLRSATQPVMPEQLYRRRACVAGAAETPQVSTIGEPPPEYRTTQSEPGVCARHHSGSGGSCMVKAVQALSPRARRHETETLAVTERSGWRQSHNETKMENVQAVPVGDPTRDPEPGRDVDRCPRNWYCDRSAGKRDRRTVYLRLGGFKAT